MENTRRNFALSLMASSITVWLYFGFYPFSHSVFPMVEGEALNTLMQVLAVPLMVAIVVGGGLAAARALDATLETERSKLALVAPPGIVWVVFMAAMAFPLGPVGNGLVAAAAAAAIMRILQNVIDLGTLRSSRPEGLATGQPLRASPSA